MAIGVVAALAVLVAVAVLFGRRRSVDAHSVKGYHQTLSTLEHLQGGPRHDRMSAARPEGPARPLPAPSSRRAQRSLAAMNHGPRRAGAPALAVVIVVAVVGAIIAVGLHHQPPHHGSPPGSRTATDHHRTSPTTTTSTTLPARYTAVNTSATSATYVPATTSYTLSVGAKTGTCWMSVTGADGTTVMAQTLTAGSTRSFSLSGKTTILIGAPSAASLKIDGVPAVLPATAQAPFAVTLVPAS